jgi:RES domain
MTEFVSWEDYLKFAQAVRYAQRYIRTPQTEAFLEAVRCSAKKRLLIMNVGWNHIWRAQLGSGTREIEQDGRTFHEPSAYGQMRMKPRKAVGHEGRVNPKGISCFYGATTRETAMAEVRPWMGSLISVGRFKVLRDARMVDCSKYHSESPWSLLFDVPLGKTPSAEDIEKAVWTHIDKAFSQPVTENDDAPAYVPTQILAEVFKAEGYDGIAYKSTLTDDGYNLAFFDPVIVSQLHGELYETKRVRFTFSENALDQYFINDQGDAVRNVIVSVRPIPKGEGKGKGERKKK